MQNFGSLFTAYIVVWAIFIMYDFSVAHRMSRAEKEIAKLKSQFPRNE